MSPVSFSTPPPPPPQKKREIKLESRIKLNHNIYTKQKSKIGSRQKSGVISKYVDLRMDMLG